VVGILAARTMIEQDGREWAGASRFPEIRLRRRLPLWNSTVCGTIDGVDWPEPILKARTAERNDGKLP